MAKIGLVLSGGGAKGAYEAGVVKALTDARIKFDVIAGTSVGGLNATLIAANQIDDLITLWSEKITNNSVFVLNPKLKLKFTFGDILLLIPIISFFWITKKLVKIISQLNSIGDSSPLRDLVRKMVNVDKLKGSGNTLILTGTNLQKGDIETFVKTENGKFFIKGENSAKEINNKEFEKIILSSAMATSALPIAFSPETISGYQYVDGGIGNNTPLINVINAGCKDIFTVLLKPPQRTPLDTQFNSLSSIGARTLEILLENTTKQDVQYAELINEIISSYENMSTGLLFVSQKIKDEKIVSEIKDILNKSYPKYQDRKMEVINNIIIQPAKDIDLELLEFNPDKLKKAIRHGYHDTCKKLEELSDEKLDELGGRKLECVECNYEEGCEGKKIDKKFYDTIDRLTGKGTSHILNCKLNSIAEYGGVLQSS